VIPVLPCISLGETLAFYRALGFAVTHEQTSPYVYGAVAWCGAELHFYGGFKRRDPAKAETSCVVMVDEVAGPHGAFGAGLKQVYGRLPTAGLPRITRLRPGQTRFAVFDPAGSSLIFIARNESPVNYDDLLPERQSRLAHALDTAVWLRDLKGFDDVGAARVLDVALARGDAAAPPLDRARVLAARAELAVALGEAERARDLRAELAQIALTADERARYQDELQAADALERLLG
jgi:hypothetical protein